MRERKRGTERESEKRETVLNYEEMNRGLVWTTTTTTRKTTARDRKKTEGIKDVLLSLTPL